MGSLSVWLNDHAEKLLRDLVKEIKVKSRSEKVSISSIVSQALISYVKNMNPKVKQSLIEEAERAKDVNELKRVREDGRILSREIAYGQTNVERVKEKLRRSGHPQKEIDRWLKMIDGHEKQRLKLTYKILKPEAQRKRRLVVNPNFDVEEAKEKNGLKSEEESREEFERRERRTYLWMKAHNKLCRKECPKRSIYYGCARACPHVIDGEVKVKYGD